MTNEACRQRQLEVHLCVLQWPYLEAQGNLPDILKKALSAFEEVRSWPLLSSDCSTSVSLLFMLCDLANYCVTLDNVVFGFCLTSVNNGNF